MSPIARAQRWMRETLCAAGDGSGRGHRSRGPPRIPAAPGEPAVHLVLADRRAAAEPDALGTRARSPRLSGVGARLLERASAAARRHGRRVRVRLADGRARRSTLRPACARVHAGVVRRDHPAPAHPVVPAGGPGRAYPAAAAAVTARLACHSHVGWRRVARLDLLHAEFRRRRDLAAGRLATAGAPAASPSIGTKRDRYSCARSCTRRLGSHVHSQRCVSLRERSD